MPENKTDSQPYLPIPFTERELLQIRMNRHNSDYLSGECSCTAQAILRKVRGGPAIMCADLPWLCPLATPSQPVAPETEDTL